MVKVTWKEGNGMKPNGFLLIFERFIMNYYKDFCLLCLCCVGCFLCEDERGQKCFALDIYIFTFRLLTLEIGFDHFPTRTQR